MLPSCEHLHIFDATLLRSSLDFHTSLMLRWGGVGWAGARCYRHVNICTALLRSSLDCHTSLMLRY